ncbi:MAG: hypothetical protein OXO54_02560 [Chloroflexota bacterium]|nr:hypothetical protein [Chloroflexota bacterium]MDE2897186.1 hypothetical protein [Chloroflexota bacterium]
MGTRDGLDEFRQVSRAGGSGQAITQEVRSQEVFDPHTGNDGFFKTAELAGEEGRGLARRPAAALYQQVIDAVGGELTDGAGVLRTGDLEFVRIVRGGEGNDGVGLTAFSVLPQAAEGGFGGCLSRPEQVEGGGFPSGCGGV